MNLKLDLTSDGMALSPGPGYAVTFDDTLAKYRFDIKAAA
jgi:hypothetical protein